jgi:hypothetical protein
MAKIERLEPFRGIAASAAKPMLVSDVAFANMRQLNERAYQII